MMTKKDGLFFINLLLLLALYMFLIVDHALAEEKLELWVHPYLPATEIIKKFSPLADYLSEKTGRNIQVKVSKTYKSHIESVGEGRIGLAYLGPASYVKVAHIYGEQILLVCLEINRKPYFHGMIVVRKNSQIKTLQELVSKKFAFNDPNSTMGYLVPRYMLFETGVPIETLKEYDFLGSHDDVALGVLGGYYDAGGVKEGVYYKYKDRGLQMLAQSPPIAEHLFVANKNIEPSTTNNIRRLLINLKDEKILASIKSTVTGLAKVKDADYEMLRSILAQFNKLAPE